MDTFIAINTISYRHLNSEFIEDLKSERKDLNLNILTNIALDVRSYKTFN